EPSAMPRVVFVTAFDHYAVRAFEVAAVDYLLKPYDEERLALALDRVRERLGEAGPDGSEAERRRLLDALDRLDRRREYPERLFLKVGERNVRQPVSEIRWLEAQSKKVRVHAKGRTLEVRDSLVHFEELLDPERFVRVSRSAIVNLDRVVEAQPWFHGDYVLLLDDGAQVTSTRTFRPRLARFFG
ncbi:MAG: LytTR family DNA-binding domain-containing protein, partial [Holophagales bacterium]|nr:LytTR family DNA-binding domain-containing protein [Holophagales bacterium]